MSQPVWITSAGSLGTYPSNSVISIPVSAQAVLPATSVTYKLLSGSLPAGTNVSISSNGLITGVLGSVPVNMTYSFTVRCTDDKFNIKDRTFSITTSAAAEPKLTTPSGKILQTFDSLWVDIQLNYTNPVATNLITITKTGGSLPPGLEITETGQIRGYPAPPIDSLNNPISKVYNFTVSLSSPLGNDVKGYSITIDNWNLSNPSNSRIPAILNLKPATFNVNPNDPYYDYYLTSNAIPVITSGDYFSFKIIGKDFDGSALFYDFRGLPLGLVGDSNTGWITGKPVLNSIGISQFNFNVRVQKAGNRSITSSYQPFVFTVSNNVTNDLAWYTPEDLGYISNGAISDLYVRATSKYNLNYRITSGSFPPNVTLSTTGDIVGRVAQQPSTSTMQLGDTKPYTFTVEAYSPTYPLLVISRTFTLTVRIDYPEVYENLYFKATPSLNDRDVINTLLVNDELIPPEYLYRPDDPYFGKATNISYVHAYGMNSSTIEKYISAVQKNHYWRQVVLGDLKTAVAKDSAGNVIYEVVYSQVVDELVNKDGVSIPPEIYWPKYIDLNLGPWQISSTKIFTSFEELLGQDYYTSLTPGQVRKLYPASFKNMREEVSSIIGENYNVDLLPKWMTTQQSNGVILGYIQAWVICYTLPGYSETIKENIVNNWDYRINRINFQVDRYLVDKTATFDYNNYLSPARWNELPSGTPEPNPLDKNDFAVLFPQKTILPKQVDY